MPPGFDRFESFGHDELPTKHCYLRCSRPPIWMGSKVLMKMTRPQNTVFIFMFFVIHFYRKNRPLLEEQCSLQKIHSSFDQDYHIDWQGHEKTLGYSDLPGLENHICSCMLLSEMIFTVHSCSSVSLLAPISKLT